MTKSIFCQNSNKQAQCVKVRVIKAPLVDSRILKQVLAQRRKALVLQIA
ncbi:MAG: hypothetical protein PHF50_01315 [Patescibacteria group bacterium]|nr:hypothetical protein [Patescibacteria group bacterium]